MGFPQHSQLKKKQPAEAMQQDKLNHLNSKQLSPLQAHLLNCPQWNPKIGDDIVCIDEVFSSLLANFLLTNAKTKSQSRI